MPRFTSHGRDVADRTTERFPADAARICLAEKMDAFNDAICLQERPARVPRAANNRAIISRPGNHIGTRRKAAEQTRNQSVLSDISEPHVLITREPMVSRASWIPLKAMCIEIGTRSEPLHSYASVSARARTSSAGKATMLV